MSERAPGPAHHLLELQERIENLEREVASHSLKSDNTATFFRDRIMELEKKLHDTMSSLLICQNALACFMSDQKPDDEDPKQMKVICG